MHSTQKKKLFNLDMGKISSIQSIMMKFDIEISSDYSHLCHYIHKKLEYIEDSGINRFRINNKLGNKGSRKIGRIL